MEHDIDISEINMSNCAFYGRFEGERMSAQFTNHFWTKTTIEAQIKLKNFKEYTLVLIDHGLEINIMSRKIYDINK